MAGAKKLDEKRFADLVKEFNAIGEMVRSYQEEKQALMEEYIRENKRFFFGDISEKTLASSVKKTNKELQSLDKKIRSAISRAKSLSSRASKVVSAQSPKVLRASLSGISGLVKPKKKRAVKKKVVRKKKKAAKKKPMKKKKVVKKKAKKMKKKPMRKAKPKKRR